MKLGKYRHFKGNEYEALSIAKHSETLEENVIREMKEEFSVDVKIEGYLGKDEGEDTIAHFFACSIVNGTPCLGGEELERCTESNYYEIRKVSINDLDKVDILSVDMIMKAYRGEYTEHN